MERDWTEVPPGPATPPFRIAFDLAQPLRGAVTLHVDAIVRHRRPAAPRYVVSVNGRTVGSYRIEPRPAPELWWPNGGEGNGNLQYFGYATLDVLLPASHFAVGANTLELECVDGFGIFYDDLSLTSRPDGELPTVTDASVDSTILYKQRSSGLVELADVRLTYDATARPDDAQAHGRRSPVVGRREPGRCRRSRGDLRGACERDGRAGDAARRRHRPGRATAERSRRSAGGRSTRCRWNRPISATTTCRPARSSGRTASSTRRWRSRHGIPRIPSRSTPPPTSTRIWRRDRRRRLRSWSVT